MKTIVFTGPTAAGKDTIIDRILLELQKEFPNRVARTRYYTTRKQLRPGELRDEYFVTDEEFDQKVETEGLLKGNNAGYRVGFSFKELGKAEITLINLTTGFARLVKDFTRGKGGTSYLVFVTAPKDQRIARIIKRDDNLSLEDAKFKAENDVTSDDWDIHQDFDLRIENRDGELEQVVHKILTRVQEFLKN